MDLKAAKMLYTCVKATDVSALEGWKFSEVEADDEDDLHARNRIPFRMSYLTFLYFANAPDGQ